MSSEPAKRRRPLGVRRDRVQLPSDAGSVVAAREESYNTGRGLRHQSGRSYQAGQTPALSESSWLPVEDQEIGLDPDDGWYDDSIEAPYTDEPEVSEVPPKRLRKRGIAAVRLLTLIK
ncbi:hypothetical protein GALMADRAFT_148677 [Galerina marginata CBS 339.88]|uniref:Uncharacterized protein n=1 Tax=Galerina marginata (strain CBS 339.88) TaxID=685588 RepID=A0A067S3X0_GALM3|nr:hypothetical protein GALMADRAFT_148677 [Galerina marginata CBS 339.88]